MPSKLISIRCLMTIATCIWLLMNAYIEIAIVIFNTK